MNLHDSLSNISITDNNICGEVFPPDSHLEVTFQNGKREGEGIVYSRRNIKLANLSFHEDQLEGFCIIFNERGQKIRECVYEKGVKNGWIREYEKRKVVFTGMCRNDVKVSELKEFKGSKDMMEEIKDGKRIGIWKFDGDNYLSGLHYCIENDYLSKICHFHCGEKEKKIYEFENGKLIQYDQNELITYIGEYTEDKMNGYRRKGKGEIYTYRNGMLYEIDHMNDDRKLGYEVMEGKIMKQYKGNTLVYEGGWYMNNRLVGYDGEGFVCCSSNEYYKAIFDKGREVRRLMTIKNNEMIILDDNNNMIYKGGFDNEFEKKGEGRRYEYEGDMLKKLYICEDGKDLYKWLEFEDCNMIEYEKNGMRIYEGTYDEKTYKRHGEGLLYENNDVLVYEGGWKNGKRDGYGLYYHNMCLIYDGEWKDDKPNGDGCYLDNKGDVLFEGKWENGRLRINNEVFDYIKGYVVQISIHKGNELINLLNDEKKKKKVYELIIEEGCGNELREKIQISGFDHLESLTVKSNSLMRVQSLTIQDNPYLENILFIGSQDYGTCLNINEFILSSFRLFIFSYIIRSS